MRLEDVFNGVSLTSNKNWEEIKDIEVEDISYNSENCKEDYIFVAIKGETEDGHKYVKDAYKKKVLEYLLLIEMFIYQRIVLRFLLTIVEKFYQRFQQITLIIHLKSLR